MFFIATETATKESDRYSVGETEVNLFQAESVEALADYFTLEVSSYMDEYGLIVTFEEVTEAEANAMTFNSIITL